MALRQLLIARRLGELRTKLGELQTARSEIDNRRNAWTEREARAVTAFGEINENTSEEERAAFDAEAAEIETEDAAIRADEEANDTRQNEINTEITRLEGELEELNNRTKPPKPATPPALPDENTTTINERGNKNMDLRARVREIIANDETRNFINNVRADHERGVKGVAYTIPTVMLPLIRETTERYSKLLKHVNRQTIKGEAKQNILAAAPEAVWTETTGKINEVDLSISQVLMDGSKLGAYVSIPNPYLEDSDENLAAIIVDYLGQSNGYALDKAIIYGDGKNMPIGIMTRLGAASSPTWWQTNMPAFTALNTTHIGKLSAASVTGSALFKEMMKVLGNAKQKYTGGIGDKFWTMSEDTYMQLQSELLSINAAGAVVTGAQMTMPIIGGAVETLDFIPSGTIIGGYGNQYLLVERAGIKIESSAHVQFLDDNTVLKSTSRWDGIPVAGEGFSAFSLNTTAPETTTTFAEDKANAVASE